MCNDLLVNIKQAPDLCGKINFCFIKVRVISCFDQVLAFTKKPSPRLSTNLYDQSCFYRRDQFKPSMGSSDRCTDNCGLSKAVLLLWIFFLLFMVHVRLCYAVLSVPCGLVVA